MSDSPLNNYEVGYKRPPKEHQFQPGQSGNPKGRPKKDNSLAMDIQEELNETIPIVVNGKKVIITKQRALVKKILNDALGGKISASKLLLAEFASNPLDKDSDKDELSIDDAKILEDYLRRSKND